MKTVVSASQFRGAVVAGVTFGLLACSPVLTPVSSTPTPSQRPAQQLAARELGAQITQTSTATPNPALAQRSAATTQASQARADATARTSLTNYAATSTADTATREAVRTSTAAAYAVTRTSVAVSNAATLDAIKHPPPTPANEATRSASMTAITSSKATTVALSRTPGPAPTFDTSNMVGGVDLDLPMTLGQLQRKLDAETHRWSVHLTETNCKGNLETLTADAPAIEAKIYCTAGAPAQSNDIVARIAVSGRFGGTLKGVSIGSTRADVTTFLRGYKLSDNFDTFTIWPPDLDATIPAGRTGGPAGQYLTFTFSGSYADYGESVSSITLRDARYLLYSFPVPANKP